jgi:hypothetical protein
MPFFKRLIDFITLGSERPVRRLIAYYVILALATTALVYLFPPADQLFSGERLEQLTQGGGQVLQDGLDRSGGVQSAIRTGLDMAPRLQLAITTVLMVAAVLALMLPVSWVYMSTRRAQRYEQSIVQSLIILPIVVAGIILIVRNSVALAFSLAGVVAAIRFRTTVSDSRDTTFIFLAIAVGFAAGVQVLTVAALLSAAFNFVLLLVWRYDFGRNVLEPAAAAQWTEPLSDLAVGNGNGDTKVPDRDLVLALSPKKVEALAQRFDRVRNLLGPDGKRPRFNAVLSINTNSLRDTQRLVEPALDQVTKRWKLDEVVTNEGKPSELYYLVRLRKSTPRDEVLTAVRSRAGNLIETAELELSEAVAAKEK